MRIIAGTARGRKFEAPEGIGTRPTLDRVKEAVFGMIQFHIAGSDVLDLFSGSGNMGLEAASRGARAVICNDHDRACARLIRQNAELLGFEGAVEVMQLDYTACIDRLARSGRQFDFVFIDAPYQDGTGQLAAELAFDKGILKQDGRIVLEHSATMLPREEGTRFEVVAVRRYGKCAVTIWKGRADA